MIPEQFKFALGTKVVDKEVFDVRLIVGRVLDTDEGNERLYLVKRDRGGMEAIGASLLEENFKEYQE